MELISHKYNVERSRIGMSYPRMHIRVSGGGGGGGGS